MEVTKRRNKAGEKGATPTTSPVAAESGPLLGAKANLPLFEKLVYFLLFSTCFAIALYKIYRYPLEHKKDLYKQDYQSGWKFTGRKKDISDIEWQFWLGYFKTIIVACILHSLGNYVVSTLFPKYRMMYFAIFQLAFLSYSLSWKPVLVIIGHNILYYIASLFKSLVLSWSLGAVMLFSFVSSETLTQWQFYKFARNSSEGDFVLFASMMCQLRGISFCLDSCLSSTKKDDKNDTKQKVSYGFTDLLGYNLYLPLFCNGPVVLYNEFYEQVNKPPKVISKDILWSFARDGLKTLWWFLMMELGFHYMYITSLARDPYLIEHASPWLSTGLMYTLVLLFSIKYVVFYRFAGMFARLEGIHPPGIPKCVLSIYTFTEMWKYFDKGLHSWLMRYIYIPLGGSKKGILRQIVSSIVTFAYVYYWHGAYDYLLYWTILQWCGVFSEAMTGKLLKTEIIQHLEKNILSPAATRRLHALFGVFSITLAILSNCVFLINYASVVEYVKVIFIKGGVWTFLSFVTVTYCLVQTIMEVKIQEIKQNLPSKKNL